MPDISGYKKALLKLSGNALGPEGGMGIGGKEIDYVATEVVAALEICPELAVVVGGGNIMRGAQFCRTGRGRLRADHAGMLSTVVNALVFQDALEKRSVDACVYSGLGVEGAVQRFNGDRARSDLADGKVVIFAGGTGNPLFTTDTAAALRGIQMGVEVIVKATRVDGVFSSDPETSNDAQRFDHLEYQQVLSRRLGVMDLCAISLCMEHKIPVRVLNYQQKDNIARALSGQSVGTLIGAKNYGHG